MPFESVFTNLNVILGGAGAGGGGGGGGAGASFFFGGFCTVVWFLPLVLDVSEGAC